MRTLTRPERLASQTLRRLKREKAPLAYILTNEPSVVAVYDETEVMFLLANEAFGNLRGAMVLAEASH